MGRTELAIWSIALLIVLFALVSCGQDERFVEAPCFNGAGARVVCQ